MKYENYSYDAEEENTENVETTKATKAKKPIKEKLNDERINNLFSMPQNERIIGDLEESNMFFITNKKFPEIIPKSRNKRLLKALEIASEENWSIIAENYYIIPNRVIRKDVRGDLRIPLFTFQNNETLEVCKHSALDGGGKIVKREDIFTWFSSIKSLNYAKFFCEFYLKEDFKYYLDVKKENYSIINDKYIEDEDISKYANKNYTRKIKEMNLINIVFPIMYGINEIESLDEAYCLISKNSLKTSIFKREVFEYSLHHTHTSKGESVLKLRNEDNSKIEPSSSLTNKDLYKEPHLIRDIMNTQILSNGVHKTVHNSGLDNQGYELYAKSQLPYMARSKKNYIEVLEYLNLDILEFPSYAEYFLGNCNDITEPKYFSKNRIDKSSFLLRTS